jgi:hypothetical protein
MDHLTNDLNKIHMNEQYHGKNHVHIASRAGMRITHISQSFLPTSCSHPLHLKYVLHVPSITRNLLLVFFCLYNNVLFDFISQYFFVKDRDTREVTSCSCFCSLTFLEWCFFTSCFLINWWSSFPNHEHPMLLITRSLHYKNDVITHTQSRYNDSIKWLSLNCCIKPIRSIPNP